MSTITTPDIIYPDSDGKPMAENTRQYEIIVSWIEHVKRVFRDRPDVFVAGDLLWYPVEGHPEICQAPDLLVALGRPMGFRGSYKQWAEENIAPHVVAEVMSPSNTRAEMERKLKFYELHGVQEYYVYDPDREVLKIYLRTDTGLEPVKNTRQWVSPLLGIRFEMNETLTVYGPDGKPFVPIQDRLANAEELESANERLASTNERLASTNERLASDREKLAAKLRELGINPDEIP